MRKNKAWCFDVFKPYALFSKGQFISKAICQAEDSSKKRTNEFVFTKMRRVFVHFLEESSARKKRFEIIWPLATAKKAG